MNASTLAHVVSPAAVPLIPVSDPKIENLQISTPNDSYSSGNSLIIPKIPVSRKEKRQQKKQKHDSAQPTPAASDSETQPRKPPNNSPKQKNLPPKPAPNAIPASMPLFKDAAQIYPLLICSIGNPGVPYANTLHSAGHVVTSFLSERKSYKPFSKGLSGLVSAPDTTVRKLRLFGGVARSEGGRPPPDEDWTFWQSTALMNVSGASVKRAYTEWLKQIRAQSGSAAEGRLVVVHDELESELGKVTIKDGAASAKGHNGLKSCQQQLGNVKWWRVGVGIGRPQSREPDVVANYVLGKMTSFQRMGVEKSAPGVFGALESIAAGQR